MKMQTTGKKVKRFSVWILLFWGLIPSCLYADSFENAKNVHWQWFIFRDADAQYDSTNIHALPESAWELCGTEKRNIGYTDDVIWARIHVKSMSANSESFFLEIMSTRLDRLDWYVMDHAKLVDTYRSGCLAEKREGVAVLRKPAIVIELPAEQTRDVYLKIRSQTAIQIGIRVESATDYIGTVARSEAISAVLIGLVAGLLVLVYLFSWGFREPCHAIYATGITLLGLIFPVMGGYQIWLKLPGLEFWTHYAVIVITNSSMLLLLLHCVLFLQLKKRMPRMLYGIYFYMGTIVVLTVISLMFSFRYSIQFVILNIFLTTLWIMVVSVIGICRRNRDAWFYLLGNGVLWVYLWIQLLYYYGLVHFNILPETLGLSSICLALFTFIVTMIHRVRLLRCEKEIAQQKTIELQEKLTSELEAKVEERTIELKRAKEQAERANQVKTAFFSKISHDLRAPLNWLVGLVESLWLESSSLNLSEEFLAYLQYIKKGSYYLTQLLNNIMDVGAVESGAAEEIHSENIDIGEWSENIASIVFALGKSNDVGVKWTLTDRENLTAFCSDPVKLSQVLMNLVHNAIKFTPEGKNIEIAIGLEDGQLCIVVEDEGPGLPKDCPAIFESYQQKEVRKKLMFDGVGLGLFIVKSNLAILRGSISAKNRDSGGAVFYVKIPPCEMQKDKEIS